MSFKFKIDGIQKTLERLHEFPKKLKKKWLKKAGNEGSKVALKALKANAPAKKKDWGTGMWKKSLGRKVKVFDGRVVWYAAGPRSKYRGEGPLKYRFFRYRSEHDKPSPGKYAEKKRTYKQNKHGFVAGKIYRIPITSKTPEKFARGRSRPVLYSHLIERKHGTIRRAMEQSIQQQRAAIQRVLEEAMADV